MAERARSNIGVQRSMNKTKGSDPLVLLTQGSTELVHALLANDLVDAMTIFTAPVVLGGGKKLFADGSVPHSFKLTSSRVSSTTRETKVSTPLNPPYALGRTTRGRGRMRRATWSSPCSRNAHDRNVLVRRAHSRIGQATLE